MVGNNAQDCLRSMTLTEDQLPPIGGILNWSLLPGESYYMPDCGITSLQWQPFWRCLADAHFDKMCNGLVPIGQTFPTLHSQPWLEGVHTESQRLFSLLGMKSGAFNFDFFFTEAWQFYFLELGLRNGSCLTPKVIRYSTGMDFIKYTFDVALGLSCYGLQVKAAHGYWSSYMVHALENGIFETLWLSDRVKSKIVEQVIYVKPGGSVRKYPGSNDKQ